MAAYRCSCYSPEMSDQASASYHRYLKNAVEAGAELTTALAEMDDRVDVFLKKMVRDIVTEAELNLQARKTDVHKALIEQKKRLDELALVLKNEHGKVRAKATNVFANYNASQVCKANTALTRIRLRHHMSQFSG